MERIYFPSGATARPLLLPRRMTFDWLTHALELGESRLGYTAMSLRALIVFVLILAFIRCGARRFLSKLSAIDMLVSIMIGSIGSRAITGNSAFGPSLLSIAVLIALHWIFSFISFHTSDVSPWLKGEACRLVKDGELVPDAMSSTKITKRDLLEAARSRGVGGGLEDVQDAWLERDGSISIVTKKSAD